ncbi:MAG: hypothetical protein HYZ54_07355 [Ignavibacteriae bacterium]|nr:hypothetical protein [Ignavibacteriota bacterium]
MRIPIMLAVCVLFTTIFTNSTFSQQAVQIQTNSNGVHITIRNLRVAIKQTGQANEHSASITNSRFTVPSFKKNEPALQILRIPIAIPKSREITPALHSFKTHKISNVEIGRARELKEQPAPSVSDIFLPNFTVKPTVTLRQIGIERGVQIADIIIQPFYYSSSTGELSVLDSAEIDIPFGLSLFNSLEPLALSEQGAFTTIVNQNQIPALRQLNLHYEGKSPRALGESDSANSWYKPETTYLRIATTADGVARLQAKDILAASPEWSGLSTNGLHLLYKGIESPLGLNDLNGTIDANDEYFFAGKRTAGDSTWQNCITPDAVFYLYFDATTAGKRFAQFPDVPQANNEIQSVTINKHIEEDHFNYWGDDDPNEGGLSQYNSHVLLNEGFYWANLNNNIFEYNKLFTYNLLVSPSDMNNDMLEAKVYFHTNTANNYTEPNYSLFSGINRGEKVHSTVDGNSNENIAFTIPSHDYIGGINRLYVKSDTVSKDNNGTARVGDMLINYITLSGKVKPFAESGKADFKIDDVTQPSNVSIRGFKSSQVIIIDTIHSLFATKVGISGTTVHAGAIGGDLPRISIVVNDAVLVADDSIGLYVAIIDAPGFDNIRVQRFDQNTGGFLGFINDSPAGSIIVASSNLVSVSSEMKQVFEALGSQEVNKIESNKTWTGVFQKGNLGSTSEKLATVTSLAEFIEHSGGKTYKADLELPIGTEYAIQAADILSAEKPTVSREEKSNLHDTTQKFDAIIITHNNFKEAAARLAAYRASHGWKITVVSVEDIYKEFYRGEKSPHAIKAFLKYAYNYWQKPTPSYVTIFGDASWDPRKFEFNSVETDYIPSYGNPVSDFWFTLLEGDDLVPEMAIGRLPVRTINEANDMVDKLIEYDTLPAAPWMKKFIFLTGGAESFYRTYENVGPDYIIPSPICGDTTRIRGDIGIDFAKPSTIRAAINDGTVWLSFFGHSAPTIFELDGWAVEDLNNRGRYNLLATYSCNSGAFANPYGIARNETYVITPHKGSIAAFGSSGIGVVSDDVSMQVTLHKNLAEDTVRLLGDMLNNAKRGWEENENSVMQYSLIGDPLTRLALDNKQDLYSMQQEVTITSLTGESVITEIDSTAIVSFTIRNAGVGTDQEIPVLLIHRYPGGADSSYIVIDELCSFEVRNVSLNVKSRPGTHTFTIVIDPYSILNEKKRNNNTTTISFDVFSAGLAALDPLPFWDVDAQKPAFRLVQPQPIPQAEYEFSLETVNGEKIAHLIASQSSQELTIHEAYIEWIPQVQLTAGMSYLLSAQVKNPANDKTSTLLQVPFHAASAPKEYTADWKQHSNREIIDNTLRNIIPERQSDSAYKLGLNTYSVPVSVVACNGPSYAKIKIGQTEPIHSNIYTRFNVVHLTPYDTNFKYFDFETFVGDRRDGSSEDLVRYLRDTVAWGDVVMIAPAGAGFNSPMLLYSPDSVGSMKSLTETLMKQYGATLIDSVYHRTSYPDGRPIDSVFFNSTAYALIARKDSLPHAVKEVYGYWKDTVSLEDTIRFYVPSGEISSPLIGPSVAWDSLHINADIPESSSMKVEIYGKSGSSAEEQLLKIDSTGSISIKDISAKDYPYLKVKTYLSRTHYTIAPTVSGFECIYTPTIEYALLPSKTSISADSILRGDTSTFNFELMNIAKRGLPEVSEVKTNIRPSEGSGSSFSYPHSLPKLLSEEVIGFTDTLPSNELARTSLVQPIIDEQNYLHEIYQFNNKSTSSFHVHEDTIKPHIEFRVDGITVKEKDYIAPKPLFEIIIHDNSKLVIDSAKIRTRLNRFLQPDTTSLNAKFERVKGQGDIRARLSFVTQRLEEENIVQITVEDASSNKDTLKIYLYVAKNASIENILAIPTPTEQTTVLAFDYRGQNQDAPATLDIFNMSGQAVRSLTNKVHIGANSIIWDGNDSIGDRVASGIYFYRLNVQADTYSDPVFGKIMISR